MMMPFVHLVATVAPFELDAVAYDAINRADMDAIGPDDFHILFDLVLRHNILLRLPHTQRWCLQNNRAVNKPGVGRAWPAIARTG
jgi:hypothetical protein